MKKTTSKFIKILIFSFLVMIFSCKGQIKHEKIFICGQDSIKIDIPNIKKIDTFSFDEGKSEILILEDKVIIEFYCASNYGSHISNIDRYKILFNINNIQSGIDLNTNLYWRKEGSLIYSNCKPKDTAFYNNIFNTKTVTRK